MLSTGILFAQSDSDYRSWMQTVAASNQSLQKNIAAKDTAGVAADAEKLQESFKQVEDFFKQRNAQGDYHRPYTDAVEFAKKAQTAAAAISKLAVAGNLDQASAEAKTLAGTCAGCHTTHREKIEAGYQIK